MVTEGTIILFSASFSLRRLSENKLTMLLLWCLCWGSFLNIFHQCLDDDLFYGMGWKGTKKVTKRATNKGEMILRSDLGIGLGKEMLLQRSVTVSTGAMMPCKAERNRGAQTGILYFSLYVRSGLMCLFSAPIPPASTQVM